MEEDRGGRKNMAEDFESKNLAKGIEATTMHPSPASSALGAQLRPQVMQNVKQGFSCQQGKSQSVVSRRPGGFYLLGLAWDREPWESGALVICFHVGDTKSP